VRDGVRLCRAGCARRGAQGRGMTVNTYFLRIARALRFAPRESRDPQTSRKSDRSIFEEEFDVAA